MNEIKEMGKKTSPLLTTINDFMSLVKVFMALVFVAYLLSGITLIKPDEIGIIFRMGKLVGDTSVDQIHESGIMFALPKPFDTIVKLPANNSVLQLEVKELAFNPNIKKDESGNISTIDPTLEGYCITGDENIYQTSVMVKYQIAEPIKLITSFNCYFNYPQIVAEQLIQNLTVAEMVAVSCRFTIDGLLTKDKKDLSEQVMAQIQEKLNETNAGIRIISLEISEMIPPPFLKFDFEDVQSAFVDKYQYENKAKSRRETKTAEAWGFNEETINQAMAYKEERIANANADAMAFTSMLEAYNNNPAEVSEEMKSKVVKSIVTKSGNIVVFPDAKSANNNISLLLGAAGGTLQTNVLAPDGYLIGED